MSPNWLARGRWEARALPTFPLRRFAANRSTLRLFHLNRPLARATPNDRDTEIAEPNRDLTRHSLDRIQLRHRRDVHGSVGDGGGGADGFSEIDGAEELLLFGCGK